MQVKIKKIIKKNSNFLIDTMAQVAVYMVDDLYQKDVLDIVLNEELVKKMVLMIVMDFAEVFLIFYIFIFIKALEIRKKS